MQITFIIPRGAKMATLPAWIGMIQATFGQAVPTLATGALVARTVWIETLEGLDLVQLTIARTQTILKVRPHVHFDEGLLT